MLSPVQPAPAQLDLFLVLALSEASDPCVAIRKYAALAHNAASLAVIARDARSLEDCNNYVTVALDAAQRANALLLDLDPIARHELKCFGEDAQHNAELASHHARLCAESIKIENAFYGKEESN